MALNWFNAREAVAIGNSLADSFLSKQAPARAGRSTEVQRLLRRAVLESRPLKLNLFRRAKLLGSFKWRLLERGLDQDRADELTHMLLLQLSGSPVNASGTAIATPGVKRSRKQVGPLLAEVDDSFAKRQFADAVVRLQEVLAIDPKHAVAHGKLGFALCELGRLPAAEKAFRRAIELKPTLNDVLLHLGTVLRWRGEFVGSEMMLRRAVKQDPGNADALVGLGHTLNSVDRLSDARECFEKALRLKPRHASANCGLAWLASMEGQFEEAERLFRVALESDPDCSEAAAGLVDTRRMTSADQDWLKNAERLLANAVQPVEKARLRFAMGKYFNDIGNYSRAFEHYKRANELQKVRTAPYDRVARAEFIEEVIRSYPKDRFDQIMTGSSASERPVFVVGMMRSGTSLVEQIIASHPRAVGAGELDFWNVTILKLRGILQQGTPDAELCRKLADTYLKILDRHSANALRIVDKSTYNTDHLGIIHQVFPKARIICLRRDPADVCLSCFFQQFATAVPFTMDLADLAHYYREHHRLVMHWRTVLPKENFMEVPYAELVADQEGWSRRIIEFLGLDWDPQVLEFHKTERAVLTASNWQVRQKIYSSSVGRWKNYQKFIGPLLKLRNLAS